MSKIIGFTLYHSPTNHTYVWHYVRQTRSGKQTTLCNMVPVGGAVESSLPKAGKCCGACERAVNYMLEGWRGAAGE